MCLQVKALHRAFMHDEFKNMDIDESPVTVGNFERILAKVMRRRGFVWGEPKTKNYEIWVEGYAVMEGRSPAWHAGAAEAATFKEAVIKFAATDSNFRKQFDPERMTWWGCRIYDNSTEAKRTFG